MMKSICLEITSVPMIRIMEVVNWNTTMALRKVAQPDDVARQVVVLASDELSGHITGQVVTIAGGMEGRVVHDDI